MGETLRIPRRTLLDSLLCRLGFHAWKQTGATQTVIPTGNALLIKSRVETYICERMGCDVKRSESSSRGTP